MQKTLYITTPIYYPNGIPHIGTAYTTIAADVLARWYRIKTGESYLLTGTDEHGQKVEKAANAAGVPIKKYVDQISEIFKTAWHRLNIHYDDFIRTTEPRHIETAVAVFEALKKQGDVFKNYYEGWYCVSCETFWLESQLIDGKCPNAECRRPVEWLKEEDYFFKLSAYQDRLLELYEKNPEFVQPETRRKEMLSFIKMGLNDVCVSRKGLGWGIAVPGDPERSIYVWIDALVNYLSAIGYPKDEARYKKYWPADVHLVGKDILRFHAVIWPAMLMALQLPVPKMVFANGWLTIGGCKISKSRGGHRDLIALIDEYGADPIRYFLLREASYGEDLDFSETALVRRLNTDLANDLGNLIHRVLSMIHRYFDGKIPAPGPSENLDLELQKKTSTLFAELDESLRLLKFREALEAIFARVVAANKYVDETAPWKLFKENQKVRLATALYTLAEVLRILTPALFPFLPSSAKSIWKSLAIEKELERASVSDFTWGQLKPGTAVEAPVPLFKKVEMPDVD